MAVSTSCYVDKSGWRRGEDDGCGKRVASRKGRGGGEGGGGAGGGRGDLMMPHPGVARTLYRAKKDLITRSQLDPHSTCSNGRPRSINDPTQTLIIRSFASIAVRVARWQPWPGDVIVARSFRSQLPGPSPRPERDLSVCVLPCSRTKDDDASDRIFSGIEVRGTKCNAYASKRDTVRSFFFFLFYYR